MSRSRLLLCVHLLLAGAGGAFAQTQHFADPTASSRARCAQLVEFWDRHSGGKGEGSGGMDMPCKSAVADCSAGHTEAGIRTLEDLLRRNGHTVPPP